MVSLKDRVGTYFALGLTNLWRVAVYRLQLRLGIHPVQHLQAEPCIGPFFSRVTPSSASKSLIARSDWRSTGSRYSLFGKPADYTSDFGNAPDWFLSSFTGQYANSTDNWWTISDFSETLGDIKAVWELSRFDWVLAFTQQVVCGRTGSLDMLEQWLENWCHSNPPYQGVNWKCGQEASIRVMHLSAALIMFRQTSASQALRKLLVVHLQRIAPTIHYAVGQSNNHGTSEAAALFIGGAIVGGKQGDQWERKGRYWLEERATRLIAADGTFSQYSLNYHRLMLDTYSLCEIWRRRLNRREFSKEMLGRLVAATDWLEHLVQPQSGLAPNLGANDGAQLLRLTRCDYRDYRPSVQLASVLFREAACYGDGQWNQQLHWLGIPVLGSRTASVTSSTFDDGGLSVLRCANLVAYFRYPRFRFRPSQADALHVDLWVDGENLLLDTGSYSYNASAEETAWFYGSVAHNTATFDDHDQMPRLSRFLFGKWLRSHNVRPAMDNGASVTASAAYTDDWGATHLREIRLNENGLTIVDTLCGFKHKAVVRWHLAEGVWHCQDNQLVGESASLVVESDKSPFDMRLEQGWTSRYYLEKTPIPVLAITCKRPTTLTTRVSL